MEEVAKPDALRARGGVWLRAGGAELHLGVEPSFAPARKAHPAFVVRGLGALVARLAEAGVEVTAGEPLPRIAARVFLADPFGNRIELLERSGGPG
jgi:catechol 2,3-dioxygenase-like lactoylglutathione lyase family enzyme